MTNALLGLQSEQKAAASPWVCQQLGLEHRHREVQGKGMMTQGQTFKHCSPGWCQAVIVNDN